MVLVVRWVKLDATGVAPCQRSSHGMSAVGDKVYIIGGEVQARDPLGMEVHVLTGSLPAARGSGEGASWSIAAVEGATPPARVGHAQCACNGKIYVFGGRPGVDVGEPLRDMWAFDVATSTWSEVIGAGTPPPPRSYHCMASGGSRVFVFGGCGTDGRLSDLFVFDVSTNTWEELPAPDIAGRGGANFACTPDGSHVLVAAGFIGKETNDIAVLSIAENFWKLHTEDRRAWLRARAVCAHASLSSGTCIVFGGELEPSAIGHEGAGAFGDDTIGIDVKSGDPVSVVVKGESKPSARGWAAAAAIGDQGLILFGGLAGDDENPVRLGDLWVAVLQHEASAL